MKPKVNVLYYMDVIDKCMSRFFVEHDSEFYKNEDGEYVYSNRFTTSSLSKIFLGYVKDEIKKYIVDFSYSSPEFFFIVGSCFPGENVLLQVGGKAPKLRKLVEIIPDVTYFLKESDISVDMRTFNSVFDHIFTKMMNKNGKTWSNVFFVKHRKIDSYILYLYFKKFFGSMVVNLNKKHNIGKNKVIFSINNEIDKICPFKEDYVRNGTFREIENEVYQYVDTCLNGDF